MECKKNHFHINSGFSQHLDRLCRTMVCSLLVATLISGLTAGIAEGSYGVDNDAVRQAVIDNLMLQGGCRVSVVYIGFPEMDPVVPTTEMMSGLYDNLATLYAQQSDGTFDFSYNVVTHPSTGDGVWIADYSIDNYSSLADVQNIARFTDAWDCLSPYHTNVGAGLDAGYCGELQAEVMDEIQTAYNGMESPFFQSDLLFFIYCMDGENPLFGPWVGGFARTMIDFDYFPVLSQMNPNIYPPDYQGTYCRAPHGTSQKWAFAPSNGGTFGSILTHEMMHVFTGGGHSYADQHATCGTDGTTWSYNYSIYDVRRREAHPDKPFVPFIYHDLQDLGWLDPSIEITETTKGLRLDEIRNRGQVVRVPTGYNIVTFEHEGNQYGIGQYFEISFHGGIGEDATLDQNGNTMYPSQGLAIWHVSIPTLNGIPNGSASYSDLESSYGMYSDPGPLGDPAYWTQEDAAHGYDNHDSWYDWTNDCLLRTQEEVRSYYGSPEDFWSITRKDEFSYKSNPSSAAYDRPMLSDPSYTGPNDLRIVPQTESNSLVIKIVEEGADYAIIDIYMAPAEELIQPVQGDGVVKGLPYQIEWTDEHPIIDTCDIYVSIDGGAWETIATGVDATNHNYSWTPGTIGSTASLKIEFHNVNTDFVETVIQDGIHLLEPATVVFDNKSSDTGLNYTGMPYTAVGIDFDNAPGQPREFEDLFLVVGGAKPNLYECNWIGLSGVPGFSTTGNAIPADVPVDLKGASYADYDNDGDLDLFAAGGWGGYAVLYRNEGNGSFSDQSGLLGSLDVRSKVYAGTWADYDGDGWVDLFLCRGNGPGGAAEEDVLLRNKLWYNGMFYNDTTSSNMATGGANLTNSFAAVWADVTGDGKLDLFVAENYPFSIPQLPSVHAKLFINDPNDLGRFTEESASRFIGSVDVMLQMTSVDMADVDLDGDVDLVAGYEGINQGAVVYLNDGSGFFYSQDNINLGEVNGTSSVRFMDQDLDGRPDLLLTSKDAATPPKFFRNLSSQSFGVNFVDVSNHAFPVDQGFRAEGMLSLDWNRDGDQDLYLGRQSSTNKFYYRTTQTDGTDFPATNVVSVSLSSPLGVNNTAAIGAKVEVTTGGKVLSKWVDGGSGRGGQDDIVLTFPVDQASGTVPVTVTWPNGWVQYAEVPIHVPGNTPYTLVDDTNPSIIPGSTTATTEFDPASQTMTFVFTWQTEFGFIPTLDKVTFDLTSVPVQCRPSETVITPSTYGAEVSTIRLNTGAYRHTMRWTGWDCVPNCSIPYSVSSGHRPDITSTSAQRLLKFKYCPSTILGGL